MFKKFIISLASLLVFSIAFAQDVTLPKEVYATPGPHVVVNGKFLDAKLINRKGSLLLPMRTVFEALDATIGWDGSTMQITATRGDVVVTLWVNKSIGMINNKPVTLTVAPTLINNVTYVPLRFPAEAFGGDIMWYDSLQTAAITIAPVAPPEPVVVTPATTSGTLVDKMTTPLLAVLIKTATEAEPQLVQLTAATKFTRTLSIDQQVKVAKFDDLQAGDQVTVTLDKNNRGVQVDAIYSTLTGKLSGFANKKLLMDDGKLYSLTTDPIIMDTTGKTMKESDVNPGAELKLFLTPNTTNIWKVIVPTKVVALPVVIPPATIIRTLSITSPADKSTFGDTITITGVATAGVKVNLTISYEKSAGFYKTKGDLYKNTLTANDKGVWTTDAIKTITPIVGSAADTLIITAEQLDSAGKLVNSVTNTITYQYYVAPTSLSAVSLNAMPASIKLGDMTTLTATAVGGVSVQYKFMNDTSIIRDFSTSNICTWIPVMVKTYSNLTVVARDTKGNDPYLSFTSAPISLVVAALQAAPGVTPFSISGTLVDKMTTPAYAVLIKTATDADPQLVQLTGAAKFTRTLSNNMQVKAARFDDLQAGDKVTVTLDNNNRGVQVDAIYSTLNGKLAGFANKKLLMDDGNLYALTSNPIYIDTAGNTVKESDLNTGADVKLFLTPNTTDIWKVIVPAKAVAPHVIVPQTIIKRALAITSPADKSTYGDTIVISGLATSGVSVRVTINYEKTVESYMMKGVLYKNTLLANDNGNWSTDVIKTETPIVGGTTDTLIVTAEQLDATGQVVNTVTNTIAYKYFMGTPSLSAVSLTVSPTSMKLSATATLTATSIGGISVQYKFMYGTLIIRDFNASNTFLWKPQMVKTYSEITVIARDIRGNDPNLTYTSAPVSLVITPSSTSPVTASGTISGTLIDKMTTPVYAVLIKTVNYTDPQLVQLNANARFTRTLTIGTQVSASRFDDLQAGDQVTVSLDNNNRGIQVDAIYSSLNGKLAGYANKKLLMDDGRLYTLIGSATIIDTNGKTMKESDIRTGDYMSLYLVPNTLNIWKLIMPVQYAAAPMVTAPTTYNRVLSITSPVNNGTFGNTVTITGMATTGAKVNITINYQKNAGLFKVRGILYKNSLTANNYGNWTTEAIPTDTPLIGGAADTLTVTAEQFDANGNLVNTVTNTITYKQ